MAACILSRIKQLLPREVSSTGWCMWPRNGVGGRPTTGPPRSQSTMSSSSANSRRTHRQKESLVHCSCTLTASFIRWSALLMFLLKSLKISVKWKAAQKTHFSLLQLVPEGCEDFGDFLLSSTPNVSHMDVSLIQPPKQPAGCITSDTASRALGHGLPLHTLQTLHSTDEQEGYVPKTRGARAHYASGGGDHNVPVSQHYIALPFRFLEGLRQACRHTHGLW
ncbi:uncharacterized protein LOC108939949 isoform X5 [Scleropages formosus]|uniref:uncharacterized protein LOC108939949 isoform X5 n=1 Tax=Scleropages formosus TaxID=113540 RepID=UPI00087810F9|nr:uncharacterized protein LOC108939949 isoform X5 [Scleropages formosus]